jgi:putative ABC transport system permease protein
MVGYAVSQRTHEFGLRMALGAQPQDVLQLVVGDGFKIVTTGVFVGIGLSTALAWFMRSLLYAVSPNDPLTFVVVAALLALVALVACYIPAHRATRVDPMVALRYE